MLISYLSHRSVWPSCYRRFVQFCEVVCFRLTNLDLQLKFQWTLCQPYSLHLFCLSLHIFGDGNIIYSTPWYSTLSHLSALISCGLHSIWFTKSSAFMGGFPNIWRHTGLYWCVRGSIWVFTIINAPSCVLQHWACISFFVVNLYGASHNTHLAVLVEHYQTATVQCSV